MDMKVSCLSPIKSTYDISARNQLFKHMLKKSHKAKQDYADRDHYNNGACIDIQNQCLI
jgi:hypothetical protein